MSLSKQNQQQYPNFNYLNTQGFKLKYYGGELNNPYKQSSFLETNCAVKAIMSYVIGGGMGFVLGLFMNAVETGRQFDTVGGVKQASTRMIIRKDTRKIMSQARGFALFGFFFSVFECNISKLRQTDDQWNDFWACGLSSLILALQNVRTIKGLTSSFMVGGMFGGVMYHFNLFG